jgi:cytochrome c oxidase subunit 4
MASREEHTGAAVHAGSLKTYCVVFGTLIVLTLLTAGAAFAPMPNWLHTPIALAIAGVKAALVLLFFMHLWDSPRLTWLIAFGSLLWLAIMIVLTFADYLTRDWLMN